MRDRDVVTAFVAHLRGHGCIDLSIDRWPDEENRDTADIDAVAGHLAIEHTSIDTIPFQRRDSDRFMQIAGELEQELSGHLGCRLNVTLEYHAISTGQDWSVIRATLKEWISTETPRLPEGRSVVQLGGVPFSLHVNKSSKRPAGLFFGRFEPTDESLPGRIRTSIERKAAKLARYRAEGMTTVLLVESNDIALMHEGKMLAAIQMAFPEGIPGTLDKLWYADTSISDDVVFHDFTRHLGTHAV